MREAYLRQLSVRTRRALCKRVARGSARGNDAKAKRPLCEAQITVQEQAGRPGSYSAVAYLRPWLQMEELTTSLRMVANIPG